MTLFVIALTFTLYSLGANAVEGFVNYPSWKHVPETSFQAFHKHLDRAVPVWVVVPTLIATVSTALVIFFGPTGLPRELVIAALALQLVGWVASFTVAIPIQIGLSKDGWSTAKVARLIGTDR